MTRRSRKRLLICSPGVPHQYKGASTVVFWHYIQQLRTLDFDVLNILFIDPRMFSEADLSQYSSAVTTPGAFDVRAFRSQSLISRTRRGFALDDRIASDAVKAAESFDPDVVFAVDLMSAWMAHPLMNRPTLVWLGDLNFETHWHHTLYSFREGSLSARALPASLLIYYSWKRIYKTILKGVTSIVVSSASSVGALRRLGLSSVYHPYPWPDRDAAPSGESSERFSQPSFLFFGNLLGLGSRSGLHLLLESLYPALLMHWGAGGFQIFLAGAGELPEWARTALQAKPELTFLGFVQDIDNLMAKCHAVLVPIDVPVGNRCRIVTAMRNGALVVAHSNTAQNNPALISGETCLLGKSPGNFVHHLRLAFEKPNLAAEISRNAREKYLASFHPAQSTPLLADALLGLIHH